MGETEQNVTQVCNTSGLQGGAHAGKVGRPQVEIDVELAVFWRNRGETYGMLAKRFGLPASTIHAKIKEFLALKKEGDVRK